MAPSKASGGRYQRVTTSEEYVWLGMDMARARPERKAKARELVVLRLPGEAVIESAKGVQLAE